MITEHDSTRPPTDPCIAANGLPADVVAGNILSPHSYCRKIDPILRAAHEFKEEDPDISLILCKHAFTLAQDLYPSTEARIMLECIEDKMSVIQQNVAKSKGADFDQSQDKTRLPEFYKDYREKNNVDNLSEDSIRIKENLKVLGTVLEQQYNTVTPQEAKEIRKEIESDAAMTAEETAYNIIPIRDPATTNAITSFPEVHAAILSLEFLEDLPNLPDGTIAADVLDFLQYVFGFQKDSVSNQRENIVILLSDEQSRLSSLDRKNPMQAAVKKVFEKTFDNYTKWCTYVNENELWKIKEITTKDQILYISLYHLIWGEAANVRFLPECLCYIFHHMKKELDAIKSEGREKPAKRADSCVIDDGASASYLEKVIRPLYVVISLEADINKDGNAPYSTWRNYDDLNEYFWSPDCFKLSWPLDTTSPFFSNLSARSTPSAGSTPNPSAGSTSDSSAGSKVPGKTFIEHRTFLHLYHSFHRLWIFLVMMFQGLVIIAWNDEKLDFKTLRGVLSLGPTYFFMKLFQCVLDLWFMHGAHSTTRIIKRFIWFMWATFCICFIYVKGVHGNSNSYLQLIYFVIYIIVLVIFVAIESYQSKLACVLNRCDNSLVGRFLREIPQEDCYVGRDLIETSTNYNKYRCFWLLILGINFAVAYFFLIIPLVTSSRDIVLKNRRTALAIGSLWVGVFCVYLLDVHIIYTIISSIVGFWLGYRDHLGLIKSMDDVHKNFKSFPKAFMDNLHIKRGDPSIGNALDLEKENVARFSPFWNEIVDNLLEEDYITTEEHTSLQMPQSSQGTDDTTIKWPSFLNKKSKEQIPRNQEARRRLEYFTNSLFMSMPEPTEVSKMLAFSVFTPYYNETVLYSMDKLCEEGNKLLDYLRNTYLDEWENFLARMGKCKSTSVSDFLKNADGKRILELRFWASYRGQTLARTVRGMMYNRKALIFQSYMERVAVQEDPATKTEKSDQFLYEARAYADLKFTYVITCQLYSTQKEAQHPQAADIALLLERTEALRVAFIHSDDQNRFFSKLVKSDINGKEKEVYSIELPGDFKLGEGKPENQNHAIVFTRGNAIQTIDMNQDNYFEETLKMRNLLEEFSSDNNVIRLSDNNVIRPTILGLREHIYTERASSVASFMSKQETSFVTIAQRVLANPLKVRMHYGHPDVFDRVFHITRGGISKASRGINISEDIYAGFNSTLRKGNITHHEYIQVGKGRDTELHQIAKFERKVASGNGEQVLSRDVYRLGQRFDFFRMLSFYYTSVGYYFYNWLMVITLYILLYGQLITALSEIRVAPMLSHPGLFMFLLIIYPAMYMILGSLLEQDYAMAFRSYFKMQKSGSSTFFAFSLGTRVHWFGRTILHGGSGYQGTGRDFNLAHTILLENYRHYSRSHFVKAVEMILLCLFGTYALLKGTPKWKDDIVILSGYILALTWIFAPLSFEPSDVTIHVHNKDFREWIDWLYSSVVNESWEAWWGKEYSHIQTFEGKAIETILSLRFFIIQYVVYQKMDVLGAKTHFMDHLFWWFPAMALLVLFEMVKTRPLNKWLYIIFTGFWIIVSTEEIWGQIMRFIFAFIPTGWGILTIWVIWKPVKKMIRLWNVVMYLARLYELGIGTMLHVIIFLKQVRVEALNKAGSEPKELNSRIAKAMVLAKELELKLARLDDDVKVNANVMQEQLEAGNASSSAPSDQDSQVTASKVEAFKLDMRQKKHLEESRKMAGKLVQVLKEKEEHESSIGQAGGVGTES